MNTKTRILTLAAVVITSSLSGFAETRGPSFRPESQLKEAPVVAQSGAPSQQGKHVARTTQTNVSFKQAGLVIQTGSLRQASKHTNRNQVVAGSFKQAPLTQNQPIMASVN